MSKTSIHLKGLRQSCPVTFRRLLHEVRMQYPLMPAGDAASASRWMVKTKPGQAHSASNLATITVRAWVRHQLTDYDALRLRLHQEGLSSTEAKRQAHDHIRACVDGFVDGWRKVAVSADNAVRYPVR